MAERRVEASRSATPHDASGAASATRGGAGLALGVVAVVLGFTGLSLGSTIVKSTDSPGAVVAFWRLLFGAALWHAIVAVRGMRMGARRTVDAAAWRAAWLPGVAFGVNLSCFFSGIELTPVAHAEFINALTPLVMVPFAAVRLGEPVHGSVVVAGAAALAGVALILGNAPAGGTSVPGDLLVAGGMLAWVVYLTRSKLVRSHLSTPEFMAVMSTFACATTLPISVVVGGGDEFVGLSAKGWVLVVLLALITGVASHGLIAWAQRRVAVATISLLQLAQPALASFWAATLLDESVRGVQVVGMAIVLVAVGSIALRSTRGATRA